jgi:DNA-binding NarL/FixJ family response regulator
VIIYRVLVALRTVLADDNYLVRQGVAALLAEVSGIDVVASVGDATELLLAVRDHAPDVVLTDVRMPPTFTTEGIDVAKRIRAQHPTVGVVVLSSFVEEEWCLQLVADGASGLGYLLKDRVYDIEELVHALQTVARGGCALDPTVIEAMTRRRSGDSPVDRLTDREERVLGQMATGRSNAAIARSLHLSERSIEKHISAIFGKLGLHEEGELNRRVAAVLEFLRVARPETTTHPGLDPV